MRLVIADPELHLLRARRTRGSGSGHCWSGRGGGRRLTCSGGDGRPGGERHGVTGENVGDRWLGERLGGEGGGHPGDLCGAP